MKVQCAPAGRGGARGGLETVLVVSHELFVQICDDDETPLIATRSLCNTRRQGDTVLKEERPTSPFMTDDEKRERDEMRETLSE